MPFDVPIIRPTNTDPTLFVNREKELQELKTILRQFINDPEAQTGGVLVKGDSGVGKSILSRKAVTELVQEFPRLVVLEVDGGRLSGVRGLLNKLCERIRGEVDKLGNPSLQEQAEELARIADYDRITSSDAREYSAKTSASGKVGGGIWGLLKAEVAAEIEATRNKTMTEGYEIRITDDFLRKLLCALLQDVRDVGHPVLVFLDNLDRIGRMDAQEDANSIAELVKELLDFPSCVLLLNLRTQFAHHTVDRRELHHFAVDGLGPEALRQILQTRIQNAALTDEVRQRLESCCVSTVADELSARTDNPLAFLRWMDFFLLRTDNDATQLDFHLEQFLKHNFTGLPPAWIQEAVGAFRRAHNAEREDFLASDLIEEVRGELERGGAIIPNNLLLAPEQRRYRLHHDLDFLLPE